MRILLVEDDKLIGDGIKAGLSKMGFSIDWFTAGLEGKNALYSAPYDAAILDLTLPGIDGLDILREWRDKGRHEPVLILTARDTLEDRISGLDTGADDYLVKPFALEELNARIRALLRRHNNQGDNEISVGNLRLNVTRRLVWLGETALDLTPKEYALLSRLMMKAGSPVHREILYNDIYSWDNEERHANVPLMKI